MAREIQLSQGKVALVDDSDYARVIEGPKWFAQRVGGNWYAARNLPCGNSKRKRQFLHRFILNAPPVAQVDHINGDGLNNRKCNLRLCTNAENTRNRKRDVANTSGYKGVTWDKQYGKWRVRIEVNGRRIHIGYYYSAEEAARMYDEAARKYHGEFARTNFR